MSAYITKTYWILDKDNNVILGNDDSTGIPATEINECESYAKESDSTELLDYIPYNPFFLLDDKNNVILKDDDTGIILNYNESLPDHDYTPFAVYSDTDNSLIFYYDTQPSVGDIYNTRTVTNIYTGWDTETYTSASSVQWYSQRTNIKYVSFDRTFANKVYPVSIAYWFYGFTNITDFNFDNLDTRYTANMTSTFNGCSSIIILDLRSFDTTNVTSYSDFAINCDSLEEILLCNSFDLFVKSTEALVTQQYWHDSNLDNLNDYLIGVQGDIDCLIGQGLSSNAFAVYNNDNSLVFYYTSDIPQAGDIYNDKTIVTVYDNMENRGEVYPLWHEDDTCENILSVSFDSSFKDCKPTSCYGWFAKFTSCTNIDLTNLDTSKVTTMYDMFYNCTQITTLDVSNFNTSNVVDMRFLFQNCYRLTKIDLSNFNTSNVVGMGYMFYNCGSLTELDVSGWNTTNVTDMYFMFVGCSSLTELDVSDFNTANVTNMQYMFYSCTSLTTIYSDDSNFVTTAVTSGSDMFTSCSKLVGGNSTKYDSSKVDASMAHVDTPTNPGYFTDKSETTAFAIYSADDDSLTFYSDENAPSVEEEYNGKIVTNIYKGFDIYTYTSSTQVPWYDIEDSIKSVIFDKSFSEIQPVSTAYWFYQSNIASIDTTYLDTSKVTTMNSMFYMCLLLDSVDVSHWDTSKVTNMSYMFWDCTKLTTIYSNDTNFVTTKVTSSNQMFNYCYTLVGGNGTAYDSSHITASYAHVDTSSNPGYFTAK